jgi:signal transduction histidine kinase
MDTLLRNPSFLKQTSCLLALSVAFGITAYAATEFLTASMQQSGAPLSPALLAGGFTAAAGLAATFLFCAFSHRRYGEISRLSAEIDEVLHDGRSLAISDYREGDVAVLRNEVGKVCARLSKTADDLAAERNALADALADISHQIRTPLTAIELMVPVIERSNDPRERSRKLRELESLVDRVSWLVTSLLKIARIDAGAIKLAATPTAAGDVVRAATEPLAVAFDMRDVTCETDLQPNATFVGDAAWTAEALSNILKNCMEHTPAGGSVRIEVKEDAVACRFRIQDSGPGIANADLPHIFERFYRGLAEPSARSTSAKTDDTLKADFEGAMRPEGFGIGLSLAQALINAQGGTIRASNAPEGGARFDIVFPKMTV